MRVVAGHLRGRRLVAPAGRGTRPITDRAKETLFDILAHRLAGAGGWEGVRVLDLFAGSGSLGIEALSRGALHCTFVEQSRAALQALRGNLRALGLEGVATVLACSAWSGSIPRPDQGFGLGFLDPPYRDSRDPQRVSALLGRIAPLLAPGGWVMLRVETAGVLPAEDSLGGLRASGARAVGSTRLVFFARDED